MSDSRKSVYTLGFSLVLSFMGAAAWAADEQPAEVVTQIAVPQVTGWPAPSDTIPATRPVIDAAYAQRSNPNNANNTMSEPARRRYFAMRRSADAGGGGGYWRWIETNPRRSDDGTRPTRNPARDAYNGTAQRPYSTRRDWANPTAPNSGWPNSERRYSNWPYPDRPYPDRSARSFPPPAVEPYPPGRRYRYQSANGYGVAR